MQSSEWQALLDAIPASQRENLVMTTVNGKEIAIQGIVRTEESHVAIRGRVMGTSDVGGGYFFVPYDQITYLGFQRPVQEEDVLAVYGAKPVPRARPSLEAPGVERDTPPAAEAAPVDTNTPPPSATPPSTPRPSAPAAPRPSAAKISTAELLKSLRERRQNRDPTRPSATSEG